MFFADFKCRKCNKIFEVYKKSTLDNWSDLKFNCEYCGSSKTYYVFPEVNSDVAEGRCGNYKNGYMKSLAGYKPSIMGRFRGKKINKKI